MHSHVTETWVQRPCNRGIYVCSGAAVSDTPHPCTHIAAPGGAHGCNRSSECSRNLSAPPTLLTHRAELVRRQRALGNPRERAAAYIAAPPRPRARAKKHTTTLPPGAPNAPGPLSEGALLAPDPQICWGTSSEEHLRRTIARRYHSRSLCVSCVRPCPVCP